MLPVVTCVGVWVVPVGSVSCLGKSLPEICKFAPDQLLPVVTCVGVWVVTVGSVSCLGNSQVITKSCLKFVRMLPSSSCKHCPKIWPNRQMVKGKSLIYYGHII